MNIEQPLVSVIVPSYNYEKYIRSALLSIFNQQYHSLELIIVDDSSKDKSCEIIESMLADKEFKKRFAKEIIFLKHDSNQGAHKSINEGINRSSGEYVTILNADDLFETNRIGELVSNIVEKQSHFIFSKVKVINEYEKEISDSNEQAIDFIRIQESIEKFPTVGWSLIPHNTAISTGNMLFTKELFDRLGGFRNLQYCHDWDFALRALLVTEPLYIDTTLYLYRLHGNNTFLSLGNVVDREVKVVLGKYFKECRKEHLVNKIAPSPSNFGEQFFTMLKNISMTKYWDFSKTFLNTISQKKQNYLDRKK